MNIIKGILILLIGMCLGAIGTIAVLCIEKLIFGLWIIPVYWELSFAAIFLSMILGELV